MRTLQMICLGSFALLSACSTVGPNYPGPPQTIAAKKFARANDASLQAEVAPSRWWETLGDPKLSQLIDTTLAANPSIAIAEARIRQLQATLRLRRAENYPSLSASAMYVNARLPGFDLGSLSGEASQGGGDETTSIDFYNLGLNASWELDLFGGHRRATEQTLATAEARIADLADVQVSLAAQVAQLYVQLREQQQRLRLTEKSVALGQQVLDLTQQRVARGTASELEETRLATDLAQTQAELDPLHAQIEESLNQLAMLTGAEPGTLDESLAAETAIPLPPAAVAIGDPAALLRQRPDVRSAERMLAASTAAIGVNLAKRFPSIKFTGLIGIGGTDPGDVFDPSELITLAMPQLSWNVLDFGKTRSAVDQAEAQRDEAEAQYRKAVLQALQDAETSLSRFGHHRNRMVKLAQAEASAARASELMQLRYRAGASSLIDQLDVERQRLATSVALSQGQAAITSDYIALQKSLGLGWQAR